MFSAHVANGCQFLPLAALFEQGPGVLAGVGAVVEDGEFGAHEVGPGRGRARSADSDKPRPSAAFQSSQDPPRDLPPAGSYLSLPMKLSPSRDRSVASTDIR